MPTINVLTPAQAGAIDRLALNVAEVRADSWGQPSGPFRSGCNMYSCVADE